MSRYEVVDFTREVALLAADLAIEYKLSMADGTVLSHSQLLHCPLVTLDHDFARVPGVILIH